jgi:hypothetical protein
VSNRNSSLEQFDQTRFMHKMQVARGDGVERRVEYRTLGGGLGIGTGILSPQHGIKQYSCGNESSGAKLVASYKSVINQVHTLSLPFCWVVGGERWAISRLHATTA